MPNIKSQKDRVIQSQKENLHNKYKFSFCERVTKRSRTKVKVSKSSVTALFDKLLIYRLLASSSITFKAGFTPTKFVKE